MDPAAVVDVHYSDGQLWADEKLYRTNHTNAMLAPYLTKLTIADSAEPKSIAELRGLRCEVYPAKKGADSINYGINLLKEFKLNVTKDSVSLIKELRNYSWAEDRHGEILTKPIDANNHLIDALRYSVSHLFQRQHAFTI